MDGHLLYDNCLKPTLVNHPPAAYHTPYPMVHVLVHLGCSSKYQRLGSLQTAEIYVYNPRD